MDDHKKPQRIELDEVMLAMDVVDTLRHEQQLVERELAGDERDQSLVERVKRMYASQGLEVTDQIIAEGVAALREERFAYRPPPPKGTLWLAKLYVNRGRWAKMFGIAMLSLIVLALVYRFIYVTPQIRRQTETVRSYNALIGQQQDQVTIARQRLASLNGSLKNAGKAAAQSPEPAAQRLLSEAGQLAAAAEVNLQSFDKLPLKPDLTGESFTREGKAVARRLEQRVKLLSDLSVHLDKAETALAGLSELATLRGKLAGQRRSLLAESREDGVRGRAEKLYADAVAAINRGDLQEARKGSADLQELYGRVVQEYELRITSRPGSPSGIWRDLQNNPGVRNYYIIVEAVTAPGERLALPITSEEDGTTRIVSQWGLRVDGAAFEKIRRDKLDDGIIQQNRFGVKERGYLTPRYLMPTTGKAITQW